MKGHREGSSREKDTSDVIGRNPDTAFLSSLLGPHRPGSFLQQGHTLTHVRCLCPGEPIWDTEYEVFVGGCSRRYTACLASHNSQHCRLPVGKHVFSINYSVCTNNVGRLAEQNSGPQVGEVALSWSYLGNLPKAKFPDASHRPGPQASPSVSGLLW